VADELSEGESFVRVKRKILNSFKSVNLRQWKILKVKSRMKENKDKQIKIAKIDINIIML